MHKFKFWGVETCECMDISYTCQKKMCGVYMGGRWKASSDGNIHEAEIMYVILKAIKKTKYKEKLLPK